MSNLSKSKYITYCQCPKALWQKQYKPEKMDVDPLKQARFDTGTEVGELTKRLFGDLCTRRWNRRERVFPDFPITKLRLRLVAHLIFFL